MKLKMDINKKEPSGSLQVTLDFSDCTEEEFKENMLDKDWWLLHHNDVLKQEGVTVNQSAPIKAVVLVQGALLIVTDEMLEKRCNFLGISEILREALLHFCNDISRKNMIPILHIEINGVNSRFKAIAKIIGRFTNKELKELLLCTDAIYLVKYYEQIEAYKHEQDITYKKRLFN